MKKGRGEQKIILVVVVVVKEDMSIKEVTMTITLNSIEWRKRIHVTDPN